jgi:uncharacterized membrane protein
MLDRRSWVHRFLETVPWAILVGSVVVCASLGLLLVRIDQTLGIHPAPDQVWLYGGSADGAIGVLSAIASSTITVAGVVFSASFVALQLASSQYTPRVVQALAGRWSLQSVMGMLLGSFVYSLLVLRSVRPESSNETEFIPVLSVSVAVVLALASVGALIYYVVYGMRSLQPAFLIDSASRETVALLRRSLAASRDARSLSADVMPHPAEDAGRALNAETPGYLQRIQFDRMLHLATEHQVVVRIDAEAGLYTFAGERIATLWPSDHVDQRLERQVRTCIRFGVERIAEQDIEFGFRRVADIMLKALSAAINDPTTAEYCMNVLGDMIVLIANEAETQRYLIDHEDRVRVFWQPEPFDRCVHTAFDQLRFYIGTDVPLMLYALDVMRRVAGSIPPHRAAVLTGIASALVAQVLSQVTIADDRTRIVAAAAWATGVPAPDAPMTP